MSSADSVHYCMQATVDNWSDVAISRFLITRDTNLVMSGNVAGSQIELDRDVFQIFERVQIVHQSLQLNEALDVLKPP